MEIPGSRKARVVGLGSSTRNERLTERSSKGQPTHTDSLRGGWHYWQRPSGENAAGAKRGGPAPGEHREEREPGRWKSQGKPGHLTEMEEIGAFGGTGELHLLLDRCVGQRARGTCCPPFLRFDNRVNGEWVEQKGRRSSYGVAHLSSAGDWRMGRVNSLRAD
uniref:Uncharacterized protein n=1 Tax=Oryza sativa subsp. japonica TaxID=39947 RepID=Q2QPM1_ORYSJ|nr:hypothetical protein LOC_Os12g34000 [Oryza sativa Japonica Group]